MYFYLGARKKSGFRKREGGEGERLIGTSEDFQLKSKRRRN